MRRLDLLVCQALVVLLWLFALWQPAEDGAQPHRCRGGALELCGTRIDGFRWQAADVAGSGWTVGLSASSLDVVPPLQIGPFGLNAGVQLRLTQAGGEFERPSDGRWLVLSRKATIPIEPHSLLFEGGVTCVGRGGRPELSCSSLAVDMVAGTIRASGGYLLVRATGRPETGKTMRSGLDPSAW